MELDTGSLWDTHWSHHPGPPGTELWRRSGFLRNRTQTKLQYKSQNQTGELHNSGTVRSGAAVRSCSLLMVRSCGESGLVSVLLSTVYLRDSPSKGRYCPPEYSLPEYSPPEYSAPEYSAPEYSPPEYSAPDYSPPEYSPPDYSAPEYSVPDYSPPEYSPPEYSAPEYGAPEYSPPEYSPPEYSAPEYGAPEYGAPEYSPPEYSAPEYSVPDYSLPEYSLPEYSAPEYSLPEYSLPEYSPPEYSAPEYSLPEYSPPEYSPPEYSAPEYSPSSLWLYCGAPECPVMNKALRYTGGGPITTPGCTSSLEVQVMSVVWRAQWRASDVFQLLLQKDLLQSCKPPNPDAANAEVELLQQIKGWRVNSGLKTPEFPPQLESANGLSAFRDIRVLWTLLRRSNAGDALANRPGIILTVRPVRDDSAARDDALTLERVVSGPRCCNWQVGQERVGNHTTDEVLVRVFRPC
ncbi:hypothetical protein NFI96_004642 [Prochilodus magdalenae]|nr:hypothetical protein NFI96_004642 [Prochilodus magdalenae]